MSVNSLGLRVFFLKILPNNSPIPPPSSPPSITPPSSPASSSPLPPPFPRNPSIGPCNIFGNSLMGIIPRTNNKTLTNILSVKLFPNLPFVFIVIPNCIII